MQIVVCVSGVYRGLYTDFFRMTLRKFVSIWSIPCRMSISYCPEMFPEQPFESS